MLQKNWCKWRHCFRNLLAKLERRTQILALNVSKKLYRFGTLITWQHFYIQEFHKSLDIVITVLVLDLVFQRQYNRQSERKTYKTFKQKLAGTTNILCKYTLSLSLTHTHTHACRPTHNLMHTHIHTHTHTRIYLIYTCFRVSVCVREREREEREITHKTFNSVCIILFSIHGPYIQIILHA